MYLLTLIKLMPDATNPTNIKKYKNCVLQFLRFCGPSEKISYNILKLIIELQKKDVFEEKDFQRCRVAQLLIERVRGQSIEIQNLGFTVLLKMGKVAAALNILLEDLITTTDR